MSLIDYLLYFVGIPLLLTGLLAAKIWLRKPAHPATYQLGERWAHPPILWAATDEVIGGGSHGHRESEFSVGGGASGNW